MWNISLSILAYAGNIVDVGRLERSVTEASSTIEFSALKIGLLIKKKPNSWKAHLL